MADGIPGPGVPQAGATVAVARERRLGYRWTICALLFLATTINYIDRQVLGILAPTLQREFGWSEAQYGRVVWAFTLPYGIGFLLAGRLLDRVGVRLGFAVAVVAWSVAAMGHAFARTTAAFTAARGLLGLGESAIRATCQPLVGSRNPLQR